jgi:hypothetical protein
MTSCFTSEINASSGIGTQDSRDGKGLGFPITARRRICWVMPTPRRGNISASSMI